VTAILSVKLPVDPGDGWLLLLRSTAMLDEFDTVSQDGPKRRLVSPAVS
jgi:hypothetical protein